MNQVVLIGRLTADPELRYTPNNQTAVTRFTLAVDRERTSQGQEQADFIRITVWGRQAETVNQYLSKGRQVAVNGRIQTGSYKNREGQTVYTTEVVANRVEFLGSGNGGGNRGGSPAPARNNGGQDNKGPAFDNGPLFENESYDSNDMPGSFQATDDDIPF